MDTDMAEVLGPGGPLARSIRGYEPREAQLAFAQAVAHSLATGQPLVAEVGTGTGKSYAYLAPALLSGRTTIVATADRGLQEQLWQRDLPLLLQALRPTPPPAVALLKGRANYLCRWRAEELFASEQLFAAAGAGSHQVQALARWAATTEDGDLDRYPGELGPLRARATATAETCPGPACPEAHHCFANLARHQASSASLIITNHSLLLLDADLRLRSGGAMGLLPEAEALIIDEAHHLPETAQQTLGLRLSSRGLRQLVAEASPWLGTAAQQRLLDLVQQLELALLEGLQGRPAALLPGDGPHRPHASTLARALEDVALAMADALPQTPARSEREALVGQTVATRMAARAAELRALLEPDPEQWADWAERAGPTSATLRRTPIAPGPLLRERLFLPGRPVVLCSATLATSSGLAWFQEQAGCPQQSTLLQLPSPFPYPELARLFLPEQPHLLDPQQVGEEAFAQAVAHQTARLVRASGGGAFVLCSSTTMAQQMAELLRRSLPPDTRLLVHGELERPELLRRFREDGNAVLVGLRSFWEGVDVPGRALRLVAIPRLPFPPPDDPVYAARARAVGQLAFAQLALPAAELQVRQGFGRLIRTSTDRGVLAILDGRVQTRPYGRRFLQALPPLPITRSVQEVQLFLQQSP